MPQTIGYLKSKDLISESRKCLRRANEIINDNYLCGRREAGYEALDQCDPRFLFQRFEHEFDNVLAEMMRERDNMLIFFENIIRETNQHKLRTKIEDYLLDGPKFLRERFSNNEYLNSVYCSISAGLKRIKNLNDKIWEKF